MGIAEVEDHRNRHWTLDFGHRSLTVMQREAYLDVTHTNSNALESRESTP